MLFTAIGTLVYYSVFSRKIAARTRSELCMAMVWLVIPFLPGTLYFVPIDTFS